MELPFAASPSGARPAHLGTWMVWMVHRLALNDPKLTQLSFSTYGMPAGEDEQRIAPKLVSALERNTHLLELHLDDCNLRGEDQARSLAQSLAKNGALRVLNVACNFLEPSDLRLVFSALAQNSALQELRCSNQFCDQVGWDGFQALAEALKQNRTLRKLGLELTDAHWRDQINRGLIRNVEAARKRRREGASKPQQAEESPAESSHEKRVKQIEVGPELAEMAAAVARLMADAGGA